MQNIENSFAMLEEDKVTKDRQNRRQERDEIQVKGNQGQSLDEAEDALERLRGKGSSRELWRRSKGS